MSENYTVRSLGVSDAEDWARLRREALLNHPLAFGASVPDDPNQLLEIARDRLQTNDESAVFGAFRENVLVGIVGIRRDPGLKERHKSGIWGMYVVEKSRGSGAGEMLLRATIDRACSWPGVEQVELTVNDVAQEALRLYQRCGFREWGRHPRAICWQGRFSDAIYMMLDLSNPGS